MNKDYQTTLHKEEKKNKVIRIAKTSDDYLKAKQITFDFNGKCIKPNDLKITFETITNPNNNKEYKIVHFLNLTKDVTINVFNHNNKNYIVPSVSNNSMSEYRLDNFNILSEKLTKTINKAMHSLNFKEFCTILESSQKELKVDRGAPKEYTNRYIDKTDSTYYVYKNARISILLKFDEIQKELSETLKAKRSAKAMEQLNSLENKTSEVA